MPPETRNSPRLENALRTDILHWIERLDQKENLTLVSEVDLAGPFFHPFIEDGNYGEDMWLARAYFTSRRPREVKEDLLVATRRLGEEVGVPYEQYRKDQKALPDDAFAQLKFVAENKDAVYDDLRRLQAIGKDDPRV